MNPRQAEENLIPDRRVMCRSYERCLDVAVEAGWEGFSCRECDAFEPVSRSQLEWELDASACATLLWTVLGGFEYKRVHPRSAHVGIAIRAALALQQRSYPHAGTGAERSR